MELQTDLLSEIREEINYEEVPAGTRFLNYSIDLVIFYVVLIFVIYFFASSINLRDGLFRYVFSYTTYLIYYSMLEGATKGRTIGKLITGSIAIKDDGSSISWNQAFTRSLSRLVPFEPFSAIGGHPWHDTWTKTQVVKYKKLVG